MKVQRKIAVSIILIDINGQDILLVFITEVKLSP